MAQSVWIYDVLLERKKLNDQIKIFQTLVNNSEPVVDSFWSKKNQKGTTEKCKNGLRYETSKYKRLISFLKSNEIDIKNAISENQCRLLCIEVYSQYHKSTANSLMKFISEYKDYIIRDVKSNDQKHLLAPEVEIIMEYHIQLIFTCVYYYPEELFAALYKYKTIKVEIMNEIISYMGRALNQKEKEKFKNCFKFYNLYLQSEAEKILEPVLRSLEKHEADKDLKKISDDLELFDMYSLTEMKLEPYLSLKLSNGVFQYCLIDDIANFVTVDQYLKIRTHKINLSIVQFLESIPQFQSPLNEILDNFYSDKTRKKETAERIKNHLLQYLPNVNIKGKKLVHQILRYLNILHPHSSIHIQVCNDYTRDRFGGAKICTKTFQKKGTIFKTLSTKLCELKGTDEKIITKNGLDFSVFFTGQKKHKLWLGPCAYINHSCKPNSTIYSLMENKELCLQATQDMEADTEINWHYGIDFFDQGECECVSCLNESNTNSHQNHQ
ncbi:hypothetical protein TKK_0012506 [Trichogramma kaykai]|uniref:SET domain-containing protein n=1 Tax=Trichogramma kaykai TaxID=54128 RepID=A0ABD2WP15_9HYME